MNDEKKNNRALTSTFSASNSVMGGTLTGTLNALSPYTITVTAKDSSSAAISTGGEVLSLYIVNECTKTNFDWVTVSGASNTVSPTILTTMTDNTDGTYSYSYTPDRKGKLTYYVIAKNQQGILSEWFTNIAWTGTASVTNTTSTFTVVYSPGTAIVGSQSTNVGGVYYTYLKAPITGDIVISLLADDYATLYIDGTLRITATEGTLQWYSYTLSATLNTYYSLKVNWYQKTDLAMLLLYWQYSGVSFSAIPSTNLLYPQYVGTTPITVTLNCPAGYQGNDASNPERWFAWCGDGFRVSTEAWDDGNTSSGDGCSSSCAIETNYVWSGGSSTSKDTCTACSAGYYQNTGKTAWETHWGDGLRVGSEGWDDQNTSNGDGCSSTCTIESNSACSGGSSTSKDTWSIWSAGYSPNNGKTACQTVCGDGLRAGAESCDDQNTNNGDGCSSTWSIESNYICNGGSTTNKDTCSSCSAGYSPNTGKTVCQTVWGDGLRAGSEEWDDNNTSGGDGCSSSCTIESSYVCSGGSTTAKDTCTAWGAGFYQNTGKSSWETHWGDGLRAGTEAWDDQNTSNSDGCSSAWIIESNYICTGGTTSSKDTWSSCSAGYSPNTSKTTCQTVWGDGLRAGTESWDDQNTSNSDGCSSTWTIESNYVCTGGTTSSKDTCTACNPGYSPNSGKDTWVTVWGDSKRAGTESWDDSNTSNGDGWSSTWTIESNCICTGGTTSSKDTCTACNPGYSPNSGKDTWVTVCGDGKRAGTEACDDQNTSNSDGCSSTCTIESNYVCSGGTTSSKDTWSACSAGYSPNSGKDTWVTVCGDGKRAGTEAWDDQNTTNKKIYF